MRVQLTYEVNVRITDRHSSDRPAATVLAELANAAGHLAKAAEHISQDQLLAREATVASNGHDDELALPVPGDRPTVVPQ